MNHTDRRSSYSTAYAVLRTAEVQAAYARRVAAFGLPALLAPYTRPVVRLPSQRVGGSGA